MKKNLLLLLGSLAFSFAIAEIICRIKGNYLSYNERTGAGGYTSPFEPDDRGWTHCYYSHEKKYLKRDEFTDSWAANKEGLKEKAVTEKKEGKRLLVLGDSYAEGVGAPPDSSYPRILESLFWQNNDSTLQVINAGIGGSDIFFEYKLLLSLNTKYKPDALIVTCNSSDIFECITRGGFERFMADDKVQYKSAPWFEPLYAHSLLVRLIVHDVFHYDYNFILQKNYARELIKTESAMCSAIDSFQTFCNLNHLRFGMVFHPFYTDILQPESYEMKSLISHCRDNNIPYADELDYLNTYGINRKNWKSIYWPNDGHFNSRGYELLAHCVYEFLEKQQGTGESNTVIKHL